MTPTKEIAKGLIPGTSAPFELLCSSASEQETAWGCGGKEACSKSLMGLELSLACYRGLIKSASIKGNAATWAPSDPCVCLDDEGGLVNEPKTATDLVANFSRQGGYKVRACVGRKLSHCVINKITRSSRRGLASGTQEGACWGFDRRISNKLLCSFCSQFRQDQQMWKLLVFLTP